MSTGRPAGAVFHRCALQVNPHHYGETFRGQASDGDTESHAEAIVTKAADLDVSVMAITDHNIVSGVPMLSGGREVRFALCPQPDIGQRHA